MPRISMQMATRRWAFGWLLLLTWLTAGDAQANDTIEKTPPRQPNVLWLTAEDIGPHLGCYGNLSVDSPQLDALAKRGLTYNTAWSNYPVCAPARTTIITGMYASSLAAGNMRSEVLLPPEFELFPVLLRKAGYYCSNNNKTDYNLIAPGKIWDESSSQAHYRNRKPNQPFFSVFNYTGTHESKIRKRPHRQVIDPKSVSLPAYWPDVPPVRQDWAQYLDNIGELDRWIGERLQELADSGESENTIVIFLGDHGSGMPRHKRYAGDSGMRVPLIVSVPEAFKNVLLPEEIKGTRSDRLVGFVDLAPSVLSVAGIKPPDTLQGQAFLGPYRTEPPKYLYGFRDRMDERPDVSRSVRDQRFLYVRNFMPHLPAGQWIGYQQKTPTTAVWWEMYRSGKLNPIQSKFWQPHPPEELFDLQQDPEETNDLAGDPAYAAVLERFRKELRASSLRFGDLGLIPETIASDFGNRKRPRRSMLDDPVQFPMELIFDTANLSANRSAKYTANTQAKLSDAMTHASATVRYWGALGVLMSGPEACQPHASELRTLVSDPSPAVAIVAAEASLSLPAQQDQTNGLETLLRFSDWRQSNLFGAIQALNAIDRLDGLADPIRPRLVEIPQIDERVKRGNGYIERLQEQILAKESAERRP